MHTASPDHDTLQRALDALDTEITASEVHGTLCGLLCANTGAGPELWQQQLWPHAAEAFSDTGAVLRAVHEAARQALNDPDCDFQLLLPGDDERLDTRVNALGEWCQGFLAGLAIAGVKDFHHLPPDAREVAEDLLEIARAGTSYELAGSEEDERAYAELLEYLRVGVLLINEELRPREEDAPPDTVH
jgi:yecA family protein